jgi:hypothetical protein
VDQAQRAVVGHGRRLELGEGRGIDDDGGLDAELLAVGLGEPLAHRRDRVGLEHEAAAQPAVEGRDAAAPRGVLLVQARGVLVQVRVDPGARAQPQAQRDGLDVVRDHEIVAAHVRAQQSARSGDGGDRGVGGQVGACRDESPVERDRRGVRGDLEVLDHAFGRRAVAAARHGVLLAQQRDLLEHARVRGDGREAQHQDVSHATILPQDLGERRAVSGRARLSAVARGCP